MSLQELRTVTDRNAAVWADLMEQDLDPDRIIVARGEDGTEYRNPVGIRLAQALHHGTDHRSQVCTMLTMLGIEPPNIDVWEFGAERGRTDVVAPRP